MTLTVLMPVYNAAPYLRTALNSLIGQTYPHWICLAMDDGSTDDSYAILCDYSRRDPRIVPYLEADRGNRGLSATLNHGLHLCQTEWVARMDADDWSAHSRLAVQMAYLREHPDCTVLGTQAYTLTPHDLGVDTVRWQPCTDAAIRRDLRWRNPFIHTSVIFQREVIQRVGGYRESLRYCPDFDLWRRLAKEKDVRFANLPDRLVGYRQQHPGSLTARYPIRKWWENACVVMG